MRGRTFRRAARRAGAACGLAAALAASSGAVAATPQEQQLGLAAAGAVKLVVRGQGWLRVTQPQLVAAGLDPQVDPANLQVFADGVEQAIAVTGNGDSTFAADEAVELYGVGRDTAWTDARTYWLVAGAAGARVPVTTSAAGGGAPASFTHVERIADRAIYLAGIRNGDASNFFSAAVSTTPTMKTLTVHHLDATRASQAILRVSLQGVTATAHAVDVSLGGTLLGTCTFSQLGTATFSFAAPNIAEGDNAVTIVAHATSDYTALQSLELEYAHTYAADDDTLTLTAPAATRLTISGFSTSSVRVVDLTDAAHPIELGVTVTAQGATTDARVDVPPGGAATHTLYAFTAAHVGAPAAVVEDAPSTWAASHDGELVILSHASFLAAMAPLVTQRSAEGWSPQLVDLQDVYDEFGFGEKSPGAIRDFLQATRTRWRVPPRFVLLVGDATFDPRNFLGHGDFDFAPTELIDTATMETASDDWFVDADLDGVPEVAIGRLPVRTAEQAATVVQKTLAYAGRADLARGGLFVSDVDDLDLDFSGASAAAEAKVSDIMPVTGFHRGDPGTTSDALLGDLDAGPFLVNYIGHGSVEVWDDLLTSAQASALTNTHSSIYVAMNCLNGFFHDLYTTSLAEALLEAPNGGAVAVWASSTLAEFAPQPAYNQEFLMRLSRTSLGESTVAAKQAITDLESRRTWLLFGDPTLFGTPRGLPPADAGTDATAVDAGAPDSGPPDAGAPDASSPMNIVDAGVLDATPADAHASDGGAPPPADAATSPDAGATAHPYPAPASDGCGCRFGAGTPTAPGGLALLLLGGVLAARRRRVARRARRWPLALLLVVLGAVAWSPRAEASYSYRKAITIDRTRIGAAGGGATLAGYPLLLSMTDAALATVANGGHVENANGYDISFQGADTTTCGGPATCTFKYEIESYSATTGQVIAWVQIPVLNTIVSGKNTIIYVKYGDATVTMPTQNVNGTWDSNFRAVWHLNQNPGGTAPQMTDSTATAASATSAGSPTPSAATGLIGAGVSTSGTTGTGYFDYRSVAFDWSSSDVFTYSGWFNTSDANGPLISQRNHTNGNPVIDLAVGYNGGSSSPGKLVVLVRDDNGGTYAQVVSTATVNDSTWHYFTVTRTGGTIELFVDGASLGVKTDAGASSSITTSAAGDFQHIGKEGNWVQSSYGSADQQYLGGSFDEYRVSKSIRSTDWIATDYKTQIAPASTFSISGEAMAACGDGLFNAGEGCDDGNLLSGDGCSATCTVETGYTCAGTPSVCSTTCGDGIVAASEACDDHNNTNGDGCSSTCTVESTYVCSGSPSVCKYGRFDYYKTIVVDHTKVGAGTAGVTTLANYPVLFSVTDSSLATIANGGRMRNANAYDMVFRGLDLTTCGGAVAQCTFAHEIEKYDPTTGQLIAWVNIPGLRTKTGSTDTTFQILFGNQAISTTSELKTATWSPNFTGVWHLQQDPTGTAPQMLDSTSFAIHGTSTSLTAATGEIGAGISTNGTTSFMNFSSGTSNVASGGAFSTSVWVKTTDNYGSLFSFRKALNGNPVVDVMVGFDGGSNMSGSLLALVRDDTGSYGEVNGGSIVDNSWHHVTVTRAAMSTTITLYLDGVSKGFKFDSGLGITTDYRNLGREGYWTDIMSGPSTADQNFLAATFDELRTSNTERTIDWVVTDYNNQSSPSTFYTYTTGSAGEVVTNGSTEVSLSSLDATETSGGTAISWQTTYEVDTLGFNVYREVAGRRVQLNGELVAGAGVSGGGGAHRYTIVDPGSFDASRTYWLEEVHFSLASTWFGPVAPASGAPSAEGAPTLDAPAAPPSPTPLTSQAPGESATGVGSTDQLGGCALAARGRGGLPVVFVAVGLLALARRRRRAS